MEQNSNNSNLNQQPQSQPTINQAGLPQQPQQPTQPISQPQMVQSPQSTPQNEIQNPHKHSFLKIIFLLLIVIATTAAIVFGVYWYFNLYKTTAISHNANIAIQPTSAPQASPTPTGYQINPNDSTNQAIDQDTTQIDKNMTNLNTDLTNVDQGVNDKQTNLQ